MRARRALELGNKAEFEGFRGYLCERDHSTGVCIFGTNFPGQRSSIFVEKSTTKIDIKQLWINVCLALNKNGLKPIVAYIYFL